MVNDDDINDFRPDKHVDKKSVLSNHDQIAEHLDSIKTRDKIKLRNAVKEAPVEKGIMNVEIPKGLYQIDLRTLLDAQIADCPATVIPMLIDHGVRTAVDTKETYKPEKRTLRFEYWWVLVLMIILIAGLWFAMTIFG